MLNLQPETIEATHATAVLTFYTYDINYNDGVDKYLYFTDWSQPISWNGNAYIPMPIKCSEMRQATDGTMNDITVSIGNIDDDRVIQQIIENDEIIGKRVAIRQFFLDKDTLQLINDPIAASFVIKGAKATKGQVDFQLSVGFDFLLATIPNRKMFAKFCRWRVFKGTECQYAGADTTCGKTFRDCTAKGNVVNFGGFPAMPNQRLYF